MVSQRSILPKFVALANTLLLLASPICDSYVRPATLVRICEECNFGYRGKCTICGSPGISVSGNLGVLDASNVLIPEYLQDAYYCAECTRLEKDRDGCPTVVNLGASRTDLFYLRKKNQNQR